MNKGMTTMARWRMACLAVCLPMWSGTSWAAPITVQDDRGIRVTLPSAPKRIVTLLPSLTETVCALNACGRIVGTDRYSNHPAEIAKLPKTGGLDDANVELIATLKPDVVLLALSSRVTERLEALGIKVIALEPRTYVDVKRVVGKVAQVLGEESAGEKVWRIIDATVMAAARGVPASVRGMTVYYEVDSAPYAAGESSFIGETLHRLGLVNVVKANLGPFPKLNPEFVVRADPQWIMVSARGAGGLAGRPGWSRIRAVKDGRVCVFKPEHADVLSRPGPRMGEAAQLMVACLRELPVAAGGKP
jgi:iron complex transport system substrate-binding protein